MRTIRRPAHPGKYIWEDYLSSQAEFSPYNACPTERMKYFSQEEISDIIDGFLDINENIALRLALEFRTTRELWINMQSAYDKWEGYIEELARNEYIRAEGYRQAFECALEEIYLLRSELRGSQEYSSPSDDLYDWLLGRNGYEE